jgi:transmembrane sensor
MKKSNSGFPGLLQRYQQGKCTEEEREVIDQWFNTIHHEIADKPLSEDNDQIMQRLWAGIQSAKDQQPEDIQPSRHVKWYIWPSRIAAACLCILIGFAVYKSGFSGKLFPAEINGRSASRMTELVNKQSSPQIVKLPDNSQVTLEPGSAIYYRPDFGAKNRVVHLKGSGFFQVSHNKEKPFLVFAGKIVTRVVGTSFTIKQNNQNLEVAVMTGKVLVENTGNKSAIEGILLTQNEKVTYDRNNNQFETGLVSEPVLVKQQPGSVRAIEFSFDDTPLSDVISMLEAAYGIEIVVKNDRIKTCPIKADLNKQTLYAKLDIICAALKSHYDVRGTTIIITGGHCE